MQLRDDFIFEIPRQNDDVIRFGFGDSVRMIDRDVAARQKPPLFVWAAIHRVLDQILADAAIVYERGALAWGSIPGHGLAVTRGFKQKLDQCDLRVPYLYCEAQVALSGIQAGPLLIGEDLADA